MKNIKQSLIIALTLVCGASFSANASFINFNDYTTSDYVNQAITGSATSSADGSTLTLTGNLWVTISELFIITPDSTLYFTMEAFGNEAEWYGIGFDDNDSVTASTLFQLGGDEGTRANQISSYSFGDGAVDFAIDVGTFFTGSYDKLVFILDSDRISGASLSFSNVEICNDTTNCESLLSTPPSPISANAPAALGMFAMSLFLLAAGRKRLKS
ncbi:conserved exported hypothetical protein [Alteromonas sp. 38]|uniref:hypothetical protein n=1 Tax=unclassified Alteromonas TaxID=2614992 RepID=UPI0012F0F39F|nr:MULTISPECIES: hypothetical protein [unclassified Alteromonas]CAD5280379.1 conserved exported hypothetical protein [Alteromonas sp. 154]VXB80211.1 conserved exported hypothetical protein [Alteromonas sp. 38]